MSDLGTVMVGLLVLMLLVLPLSLIVMEKMGVTLIMEEVEDLVGLALQGTALETERGALGSGYLELQEKGCRDRITAYLDRHAIRFRHVDVQLLPEETVCGIRVNVGLTLQPKVFRQFLPKEVPIEFSRSYQLVLDR